MRIETYIWACLVTIMVLVVVGFVIVLAGNALRNVEDALGSGRTVTVELREDVCQEDEVLGWVANDTRGCVHIDDICQPLTSR